MLYNLLYPLHETFSYLNIFRYITFRSIYAVVTALAFTLIIGPLFINWLKARQIGEKIRSDGPASHHAKAGTPTMGGLLIITALVMPTLLWADLANSYIWIALLSVFLFGLIGLYDDYEKLHGEKHGVSGRTKLMWQFSAALLVVGLVYFVQSTDVGITKVHIPFFKDLSPDLGFFYFPFAMLVIVGTSNAVNLTDGLDGLATVPIIVAFAAFVAICYVSGNSIFADYLKIPRIAELSELTIFCAAVVGASIGFLWYNCHPAEIFMGNVGSTALGGALGCVAIMAKQEILLLLIGGIFVVEALSVIIQVGWYKSTGKRFFRMAPLHHHFEQIGWPESKVIVRFWIVALVLALLSISTLKIR